MGTRKNGEKKAAPARTRKADEGGGEGKVNLNPGRSPHLVEADRQKAEREEAAEGREGSVALPPAGSADNAGVVPNSDYATRGPVNTSGTTLAEAHGLDQEPGAPESGKKKTKGRPSGPVTIKSRVPRYVHRMTGRLFRDDGELSTGIDPDEFTDEQWADIQSNRWLKVEPVKAE